MSLHKPVPPKPSPPSTITVEDRKKISLLLTHENYADALKEMRSRISTGAEEQNFSTLYVTAINGLIVQGDLHLEKNELAQAGMAFRLALDNYPSDELLQRKVKRSSPDIKETINRLSVAMMDAALLKYRAGALEEAITIWDKILSFDPQNVEARKARETAKTQLENLRKIE